MVAAFLGMMGEDFMKSMNDEAAPEANAYEFQGGGIVDMLKKLKDEFRGKLGQCQKEEMNSKHAYDMVVTDLVDSIENSNDSIEEKKQLRKEEIEAIGQAIKILQSPDAMGNAEKYLDLAQTGNSKATALAQLRSAGQSEGIQGRVR